jgi:hypothetical protein
MRKSLCLSHAQTTQLDQLHQPHQLADIEAHSSRLELISSPKSGDRPNTQHPDDLTSSQPNEGTPAARGTPSAECPTAQYFRQPRYNSIRGHPKRLDASIRTSTPSRESLASAATSDFTSASSTIARSALIASNQPVSPPQNERFDDDDWNDTSSVPLGPRWQDYTYREGDSFYGGAPKTATNPSITSKPVLSTKDKSSAALHGSMRSVSGAVLAMKSSIVSTLRTKPVQSQITGFEVVRPTRVPDSESQSESTE